MAITIEDIQKKQFSTRSRGYDKFEVDTFLEDIIMQMEQMDSELEELRRKCSSLYETINVYKQTEDSSFGILRFVIFGCEEQIISRAGSGMRSGYPGR